LPEGYAFEVWRDEPSGFAAVVDGRATLEFEREGVTTVTVHISRAAAGTTSKSSRGVTQPVAFTVARGSEPQRETLVVTRKECELAMAKLESAR